MKILLDENIPWPLSRYLSGHEVTSVQRQGWAGVQNGDLIKKADGLFDALILADKNLRYQQNLKNRSISFIELPTNRWPHLQELIPRLLKALEVLQPGAYVII
jgi:hypothetical protein